MAKMRYTEMPRDVSADSLSALRTIESLKLSWLYSKLASLKDAWEAYEKDKKSPTESVTEDGELLNGCGEQDAEQLLKSWSSRHHEHQDDLRQEQAQEGRGKERHHRETTAPATLPRIPKAPTSHKLSSSAGQSPACYDNLGAWKSHSLPGEATLRDMDSVVLEALRVNPEDLASQLTLLDLAVFKRIGPDELASCAWNKKNKLTIAPNVVAFTQRFNHVSFWTVQEVLSGVTPKHRAEIIAHFIRICKKLYDFNNFHSLFAVVSALRSASVYRLSKTWATLTKRDRQTFDKLAEVFSDQNNWQNLREHVESLKLPCIPYLGVFLTDLVYIDMAHPLRSSSGVGEDPQRTHKMNNILRIVANLQESKYPGLPLLPHIQRYLRSVRYIDELQKFVEDDQYKLSLRLEPPSPVSSWCSSKESVTGDSSLMSLSLSPAKLRGSSAPSSVPSTGGSSTGKFVPGHRKSSSLGSKLRSASLPRNLNKFGGPVNCTRVGVLTCQSTGRHLLDDSVIEEASSQSHAARALQHLNLSPLKRLPILRDEDIEEAVTMQGCLRRKTILKDGRKPAVASWQRYWVQLWANSLVFYLPKAFKGTERTDYRREPCKVTPTTGCLVSLSDNPMHPDIFHIRDPIKSNLYKFKACSREEAQSWFSALQETLGLGQDADNPANLISFE